MANSAANGAEGEQDPNHTDPACQSTAFSGEAFHDEDSTKPCSEPAQEVTKSFDEQKPRILTR